MIDVFFFFANPCAARGHSDSIPEPSWWSQVVWGYILSIIEHAQARTDTKLLPYNTILWPSPLQLSSSRGPVSRGHLAAKPGISQNSLIAHMTFRCWFSISDVSKRAGEALSCSIKHSYRTIKSSEELETIEGGMEASEI